VLCPNCVRKRPITDSEKEIFQRADIDPPVEIAEPDGCESCFQSGYRGRTGVYEVIIVDRAIRDLIFSGAMHGVIEDTAIKSGTTLMYKQALKKVAGQITSFEEISRVVVDYA
jgi:type II secretory ATPase GspE/PulE/Tfp pilus assembly ATPase PilB-like protein